ncbi:sugar lactone lactonase YvrE [Pseudomonas sp. TE3786]
MRGISYGDTSRLGFIGCWFIVFNYFPITLSELSIVNIVKKLYLAPSGLRAVSGLLISAPLSPARAQSMLNKLFIGCPKRLGWLLANFAVCIYMSTGYSASVRADPATYFSDKLIPVADLGHRRAVGLSVSSTNRLFITFPGRTADNEFSLAEVIDGKLLPYPDQNWNAQSGVEHKRFVSPQAAFVDAHDNLWVLDSKPAMGLMTEKMPQGYFNLVKINLATNKVEKQYAFEGLDKARSSLNDVNIDVEKNLAYLSDPGQSAIVVLDLNSGVARTLLSTSPATRADPNVLLSYNGQDMRDAQGKPFRSNVNGIALTKDNRYLYFKAINTLNLYRIETRFLADPGLDEQALNRKVEDQGKTVVSHGLIADAKNTIYLTSSLDYSIKYRLADGGVHTLVQDSRLLWPDSFGIGSDGFLYLTAAQYQRSPQWNKGQDRTVYPFRVYKVSLAH